MYVVQRAEGAGWILASVSAGQNNMSLLIDLGTNECYKLCCLGRNLVDRWKSGIAAPRFFVLLLGYLGC